MCVSCIIDEDQSTCSAFVQLVLFSVKLQPHSFTLTALSFDCQYRVRVWPTISSVDTEPASAAGGAEQSFSPVRARPLRPSRFRGSRSAASNQQPSASLTDAQPEDNERRLAVDTAAALSSLQSSSSSSGGGSSSSSGRYAGRARPAAVGSGAAVGAATGGNGVGRGARVRDVYSRRIRTNGAGVSFYLNYSEIRFVTPSCDRMRSLPPDVFCPTRMF